jgi:hypothetical protein
MNKTNENATKKESLIDNCNVCNFLLAYFFDDSNIKLFDRWNTKIQTEKFLQR